MAVSVEMPPLGASVTEATVSRWLKKPGEAVQKGEPLLEVSTDKVDSEIPSPASGLLLAVLAMEGNTVAVGALIASISDVADPPPSGSPMALPNAGADRASAAAPARETAPPVDAAPPADATAAPGRPQREPERPEEPGYITPLVHRLAAEHDIDLQAIVGTGTGGRVRTKDILDAAAMPAAAAGPAAARQPSDAPQPSTAPAPPAPARPIIESPQPHAPAATPAARGATKNLTRLRKVIAARMVDSLKRSAQLTTVVEVDVTRIARLRQQTKDVFYEREGVKLTYLPFVALAAVEALKAHPVVNSSIDAEAGTVTYHDGVHLGMAVDTDRGLLVPVIRDAGHLTLAGLARKTADLASRTRAGTVTADELGGGTFTLTNTGSRGALFDTPILNLPQAAILGVGSVVRRPAVVNPPSLGEVVAIRSMLYLALTYDHQIVDGADAARYLTTVRQRLEAGAFAANAPAT